MASILNKEAVRVLNIVGALASAGLFAINRAVENGVVDAVSVAGIIGVLITVTEVARSNVFSQDSVDEIAYQNDVRKIAGQGPL